MKTQLMKDGFELYVIYFNLKDFPNKYVVRSHVLLNGSISFSPLALVCDTLHEAREGVPIGKVLLGRDPEDDSTIIETWI